MFCVLLVVSKRDNGIVVLNLPTGLMRTSSTSASSSSSLLLLFDRS